MSIRKIILPIFLLIFTISGALAQWKSIGGASGNGISSIYQTAHGEVLVLANNAVWVSSDWGKHWSYGAMLVYKATFGEDANNNLYATGEYDQFGNTRAWRSTDHGKSWQIFYLPFYQVFSIGGDRFGNIYAGTRNGMWKSSDQGNNWKYLNGTFVGDITDIKRSPFEDSSVWFFANNRSQSWKISDSIYKTTKMGLGYNNIPVVNAVLPNGHIIANGYDLQLSTDSGKTFTVVKTDSIVRTSWVYVRKNGDLLALSDDYYIIKSTDEGKHWLTEHKPFKVQPDSQYAQGIYGLVGDDMHFVLGTPRTLYRSEDGTLNVFRSDTGFMNVACSTIVVTQTGRILTSSSYDGIWYSSGDGNWKLSSMPEDELNYSGLFERRSGELFATVGYGNRLIHSSDDGLTWTHVAHDTTRYRPNLIERPDGALFGAADGVGFCAISTDDGSTWTSINNAQGAIQSREIPLACDSAGHVYYGGAGYGWYMRYDMGGLFWQQIDKKHTIHALTGNALACTPSGSLFFTTDSCIYRSTDLGESWQLTLSKPTRLISVDPSGVIFSSSQSSPVIYVSSDNGDSWVERSEGIPPELPVTAITIDKKGNVFIAVLERGLYSSSIKDILAGSNSVKTIQPSDGSLSIYPNPASEEINIRFTTAIRSPFRLEITDMLGRVVYAQIVSSGANQQLLSIDCSNFLAGNYVCSIITNGIRIFGRFIKR